VVVGVFKTPSVQNPMHEIVTSTIRR